MELSDAEVMARAAVDPGCFVVVFDRHGVAVHAFLARRAGAQAADDLLSEVWVQAMRAASRYDGRHPSARPWLYGIARNVLRAHWRSRARNAGPTPPDGAEPERWEEVDAGLDAARRVPALAAALRALPTLDREVLLLVAWEGLTPSEVGVALRVPAGTVRWRLHRARTSVRRHLGDLPNGSAGIETAMGV